MTLTSILGSFVVEDIGLFTSSKTKHNSKLRTATSLNAADKIE